MTPPKQIRRPVRVDGPGRLVAVAEKEAEKLAEMHGGSLHEYQELVAIRFLTKFDPGPAIALLMKGQAGPLLQRALALLMMSKDHRPSGDLEAKIYGADNIALEFRRRDGKPGRRHKPSKFARDMLMAERVIEIGGKREGAEQLAAEEFRCSPSTVAKACMAAAKWQQKSATQARPIASKVGRRHQPIPPIT